jgi:arylmalonate decarboxylase
VSSEPIVGLVTPGGEAAVPVEAELYPGVRFITAGLGLQRLTPDGYDAVIDGIVERAEALAQQGAEAIGVSGTSLTFYRGYTFHEQLKESVHTATGLPVTTMSTGVVEGLRALGVRRVAVGTAYIEEVNNRLRQFLVDSGFEVGAVQGLGIDIVGEARSVSEQDLIALGQRALAASPGADGILISCGGLRTLGVTVPLEAATGLPVVSSTPAAFWAAVRLVDHSGAAPGFGRLFEQTQAAVN